MASATCEIAIGFRSSAEPGTTNSQTCAIAVGFSVSTASAAWSGTSEPRDVVDWLPRIDEAVIVFRDQRGNIVGRGYMTPRLWNYLRELGSRMGGVQGASIPDIQTAIVETQQQVVANTAYVDSSIAYTTSVAATATAAAEVAQTNGLSGAGSIPTPSPPPNRPNYQVE
jgi:hypothetical protein